MAQLDLADLNSIHQLAKQLNSEPALDFIFLNAGVMACPQSYTKNGFEMQVGTNHCGHFELTSALMDKLKQQVCPQLKKLASHLAVQRQPEFTVMAPSGVFTLPIAFKYVQHAVFRYVNTACILLHCAAHCSLRKLGNMLQASLDQPLQGKPVIRASINA